MPRYIVLPDDIRTIRSLPETNRQARGNGGFGGRMGPRDNNGYYGMGYYNNENCINCYPKDEPYYANGTRQAPMGRMMRNRRNRGS